MYQATKCGAFERLVKIVLLDFANKDITLRPLHKTTSNGLIKVGIMDKLKGAGACYRFTGTFSWIYPYR